jgi:hypothetical protein
MKVRCPPPARHSFRPPEWRAGSPGAPCPSAGAPSPIRRKVFWQREKGGPASRSTVSRNPGSVEVAWAEALAAAPRRWLLVPVLIAAVILTGAYEAHLALQSPGAIIRHGLVRAGVEVADLAWSTPTARVQQTVSQHFPDYRATVDAARFPADVTVTLHDLDPATCRAAYRSAARIEGRVVIALQGPGEPACRGATSLTWRIMP